MSTENSKQKNAREKILSVAAEVFAEKSFDGARVDEIAAKAQVPKSLIYYHFKSKDEIFHVLIQEFLEEYESIRNSYHKDCSMMSEEEVKMRMQKEYFDFGIAHENVVRALLMDSIKKRKENTALFQMMDLFHMEDADKKFLVEDFLFQVIPCMAYICFKKEWIGYYQMEESIFDQAFLQMYTETHTQSRKRRAIEKKEDKK